MTSKTQAKPKAAARKPAKTGGAKPRAKAPAKPKAKAAKVPARPAASKTATTPRKPKPRAAKPATRKPAAAPRRPAGRAPKPKGLEAKYSGVVFRSRLEARWAILMDLFGINWDYEPCHYQVGPELYYLPDFYLPEHRLWLEVKGPAFMDAASMAKCLAAVAGPMPLPLREAPYTAADRLLIAGPLPEKLTGMPLHTLVTPAAPGRAGLSYAVFGPRGPGAPEGNWDEVEADGIAKARRPAPPRLEKLLTPAQRPGPADPAILDAYRFAATAVFDDAKQLSHRNDRIMMARLAARRAGRPLGPLTAARAAA